MEWWQGLIVFVVVTVVIKELTVAIIKEIKRR